MTSLVLEQGSLVDAIRRFPVNLTWFSTPELLEIGGIPFVVPTARPTRVDALKYYQRVSRHFGLDVRLHDAVEGVVPVPGRGFRVVTGSGAEYVAGNVVIATGYFDTPNRLEVPGEDGPHVRHYYGEPFECTDCDVAVVGGRNSAVEAALDLFRNGARVTLVHRGETLSSGVKYWILPDIENRIAAREITAVFRSTVRHIGPKRLQVATPDGDREVRADFVFVLIGFRPDTDHLRRFGVAIDPATLAPVHDPETFETNVTGLYVAGSIVAGKNNNKIFVENGRLHGRTIVESIIARR